MGALVRDRRRRSNFFAQLGFLGNTQNTLWSLTGIALSIVVLYALTARWSESQAEIDTAG